MSDSSRRAVVLTSGGLDSTTCLAVARDQGYEIYALSFDYGQRHDLELRAAQRQAEIFGAKKHVTTKINLDAFGGSALTDSIDVPKHDSVAELGDDIPVTYVPARNLVFLSFALGWAEVLKADAIFIGVNALDYSGYPDCRPEFIESFVQTAKLATADGVSGKWDLSIEAPLMKLSKAEIIKLGVSLGVDYSETWSCYDPTPDEKPCGRCDSCLLRKRGFEEAGIEGR